MSAENRNTYLDQVVAQQQQLEQDLRPSRSAAPQAAAPAPAVAGGGVLAKRARAVGVAAIGEAALGGAPAGNAVDVRITGFGRWKTVVVPPNAFVVHTRRGHKEPLHVGQGVSFRYRPGTDSFLAVPGAMQTIVISAYCICRELQGLVVQAYVQWIIEDFANAYRKLDFGDPADPMRLVNLQLKEQAEAAIKDKVATMGVHEVLSDKQPIIEELTARLRGVAEGQGGTDTGLGLRIVTVQIKEAVVSSARLWESLQKPYRSEQGQLARLAELAAEEAVAVREMSAARERETQTIETDRELADLRARHAAATYDRETAERVRRASREQEDARAMAELQSATKLHELRLERERNAEELETGRLRLEQEHALKRLDLDGQLALARARTQSTHDAQMLDIDRDRARAAIANDQSPASLEGKLIDALPEIVAKLPKPAELRQVSIGGADQANLAGLVAQLGATITALRSALSSS